MNRIFYTLILLLQFSPKVSLAEDGPSEYTNPEKIRADLDRLEQYVHKKLGLNDLDQPETKPKEETQSIYDRGELSHLHTKLDDQNSFVASLVDRVERLEHQNAIFDQSTQKKQGELDQLKEQISALQNQLDVAALEIEKFKNSMKLGPDQKKDLKETPEEKPSPEPVETESDVDLSGKSPEEIFDFAEKSLKAANYKQAQNIFEHYVTLDVDKTLKSKAHYYLGEICSLTKQPAQASDHYLQAFQLNTSGDQAPENLVKLGISLHTGGKTKAGCSALKKAKTEYPKMSSSSKSLLETKFKEFKCPTS